MNSIDVLRDGFDRVADDLSGVLEGLSPDQLSQRPGPDANPVGWLVWHLLRVEDSHVADLADRLGLDGSQPVWDQGWREKFALPYGPDAHGYGQSSQEVAAFRVEDASLLPGYGEAVHAATHAVLAQLDDTLLDRVVDTSWDPPVTAGVRLVSVVNDITQHIGQAAYAKGLLAARA